MSDDRSEGLVVRAEPMELAEQICRRLVVEVRVTEGAFLLVVDPAWAGAINTVLVKKGVRVGELYRTTLVTEVPLVSSGRTKEANGGG